jgi:cytochrome c biogenesis protein CcmG/thiol:disulfide interchange protein DsbE
MFLLGIVALPGCPASESGSDATDGSAGNPAPGFVLADLAGNTVSLEELRGRTVVIDFWATWCMPCIYQIAVLNDFHERHRNDDVVVLGIAVDVEGAKVVRPFADQHDVRYPILLGDEALARRYGAMGFPSLYVIAPDGSIDLAHVGVIDSEALEAAVARAKSGGRGS